MKVLRLVASLAKVLAPARRRADKPGDDEKDGDGHTSSLAVVARIAATRVSVIEHEPHGWCSLRGSHSRAADINFGNASSITSNVQTGTFQAAVINDAEMDQVANIEAGRLKLLVLEGCVEVVIKHRLETVEACNAGSPQAVGLKSVNRIWGQGDVEMLKGKCSGLDTDQ